MSWCTASLMSRGQPSITTEKGPASLRGTPIFRDSLKTDSEKTEVFSGSAKEAIALFPTKVNVAVATSLATTGPENTGVTIRSVPGFKGDDHRIEVIGEEVHAIVDIYSKTSAIAGWSVVARAAQPGFADRILIQPPSHRPLRKNVRLCAILSKNGAPPGAPSWRQPALRSARTIPPRRKNII